MKFTFISKMTTNIKRFFIILYQSTFRYTGIICSKVFQISDEHIKFMFSTSPNGKKKKRRGKYKTAKKIRKYQRKLFFLLLISIAFIIVLIAHSIFIVPVSDSGVVLRLGRFTREVDPGLNFKIPFVEEVYIVNTGNVLQETFGFMQVTPPTFTNRKSKEEQEFVKKYEDNINKNLVDADSLLSQKGSVLDEIQKKQPVTKQYLVEKINSAFNLTTRSAKKRLKRENKKIAEIIKSGSSLNGRIPVEKETKYITGDLSLIRISWLLHYEITNPRNYLFNSRDIQSNIKNISMAMMNQAIGQVYFDDILSVNRRFIENEVARNIQNVFTSFHLGITVINVGILDALPVREVEPAFNEINRASHEMENTIYSAQKTYLSTIPQARGEADRIKSEANAKALLIINRAKGEAGKFTMLLKEYRQAPEITKKRLYIETMDEIFKSVPNTIVDKDVDSMLPIFMGSISPKKTMKSFDAANNSPREKHKAKNKEKIEYKSLVEGSQNHPKEQSQTVPLSKERNIANEIVN